jgi:hypothetical protein
MYTEHELREMMRRDKWVLLPAMSFAVAAVFVYLIVMGQLRPGFEEALGNHFSKRTADASFVFLIPPAIAVFLAPLLIAERRIKRWNPRCPSCASPLGRLDKVIATRSCPTCDTQIIVAKRTRPGAAFSRMLDRQSRGFLVYWLWLWPALTTAGFIWWYFDPDKAQACRVIWIVPLIGAAVSGWTWIRTFDRRYVLQAIVSSILLGVEFTIFYLWS